MQCPKMIRIRSNKTKDLTTWYVMRKNQGNIYIAFFWRYRQNKEAAHLNSCGS